MSKKFDFETLKDYAFPIILGIVTIVSGIEDKKRDKRSEELAEEIKSLRNELKGE